MNFILILGPSAVGKMTVGQQLSRALGYPLFHNHHSIELTLELFAWGTPEFKAVNEGIRELVLETVRSSENLAGFLFTLMIAFNEEEDVAYVNDYIRQFEEKGWTVYVLELYAPLEERIERNITSNRLNYKASKRNLEFSQRNILEMEERFQCNSTTNLFTIPDHHYLRLNNSEKSPEQVATEAIAYFGLESKPTTA